MGKTLIVIKQNSDDNKLAAISPELMYQESFFNYLMNSNLKLSLDQSSQILTEYIPFIVDAFLKDMQPMAEILLLNYELELDDNKVLDFRQLKTEKEKLVYMFSSLVINYQTDIKNKGFESALKDNEEFYLMMEVHYKQLELQKILKLMEMGKECLSLTKTHSLN